MKQPQNRRISLARIALLALVVAPAISSSPIAADEVALREVVESGALAQSPNSILLDFLLHEGKATVPDDLHQKAVDQIVDALRKHTLVEPMQSMGEIMGNPFKMMGGGKEMMKGMGKSAGMGMLKSALGGGGGPGGGGGMGGMGSPGMMEDMQKRMNETMIDPWVRGLGAASTLYRAGYEDDASRFYRGCLTSMGAVIPIGGKNDWLQGQCIAGALQMKPADAGALFSHLWDNPHMDLGINFAAMGGQQPEMPVMPEIQAVAGHGLGKLVGTGQLSREQQTAVMRALIGMTQTKKPDLTALTGTVQGLSFAKDAEAVNPLRQMWKKGKPKEIRPVAMGGLVTGYRQSDAIQGMRKELKTGTGIVSSYKKAKSFAPWTSEPQQQQSPYDDPNAEPEPAEARYLAARALIKAEDEPGYLFALKYLDKRNVPPGDWDYRPDLVRDLVETRGERGRTVLHNMVTDGHQNEWLEAWMRIGVFELGDTSQLGELEALIDKRDWDFGRGTAARWYKRLKPLLWEVTKLAAMSYAGLGEDWQSLRQTVTNLAFAERDRILARKKERAVKTDQFHWQLADAMGEFDNPGALPILETLLAEEEPATRLSAASALLTQTSPGTAVLLLKALQTDYGQEKEKSRNPEIHAAVLRTLVRAYPNTPQASQAIATGSQSQHASVRFLALAALPLLGQGAGGC